LGWTIYFSKHHTFFLYTLITDLADPTKSTAICDEENELPTTITVLSLNSFEFLYIAE